MELVYYYFFFLIFYWETFTLLILCYFKLILISFPNMRSNKSQYLFMIFLTMIWFNLLPSRVIWLSQTQKFVILVLCFVCWYSFPICIGEFEIPVSQCMRVSSFGMLQTSRKCNMKSHKVLWVKVVLCLPAKVYNLMLSVGQIGFLFLLVPWEPTKSCQL